METIKKIPVREEIPAEDKWALEDLYSADADWEKELATLAEEMQSAVNKFRV